MKLTIRKRQQADHPLYRCWVGIKERVLKPRCKEFKYYGGRGIRMWGDWVTDFKAFASYIEKELGPRPSKNHTLDRIDNNEGYGPGNLRWATKKQQNLNKRNTVYVTIRGKKRSLYEWAVLKGIDYRVAYRRYRRGLPLKRVLSSDFESQLGKKRPILEKDKNRRQLHSKIFAKLVTR